MVCRADSYTYVMVTSRTFVPIESLRTNLLSEKTAGCGRLPLLVVVQFSVTSSPGAQPLAGSTATPDTDRSMKGASADWKAKVASLLVSAVPDAFSSATALATSEVIVTEISPTPGLPAGSVTVIWR